MGEGKEDRTELADERTEMAEERTEWADQRTYLAQERTFGGWVRTGLASMAVGVGLIELLREVEPQWLISAIGIIFIVVGGFIQIIAYISYRNVSLEMERTNRPAMAVSTNWIALITVALVTCALGALVIVLFL